MDEAIGARPDVKIVWGQTSPRAPHERSGSNGPPYAPEVNLLFTLELTEARDLREAPRARALVRRTPRSSTRDLTILLCLSSTDLGRRKGTAGLTEPRPPLPALLARDRPSPRPVCRRAPRTPRGLPRSTCGRRPRRCPLPDYRPRAGSRAAGIREPLGQVASPASTASQVVRPVSGTVSCPTLARRSIGSGGLHGDVGFSTEAPLGLRRSSVAGSSLAVRLFHPGPVAFFLGFRFSSA